MGKMFEIFLLLLTSAGLLTFRKNTMSFSYEFIAGSSFVLLKHADFRALPMYLGDIQNDNV